MALNTPQITRNLTTGSTGADVQALQEWLKAQGYFPANQPTTQTYGPITTQAVAAWQSANKIDTKGNPGSFGPISRDFVAQNQGVDINAAVNSGGLNGQPKTTAAAPATPAAPVTPANGTGTGVSTGAATGTASDADIDTALKKLGLSDAQIASIPSGQKAVFAGIGDYITKQYESGGVNSVDLDAAFKAASTDPDIVAKYGDSLKEGVQQFQTTLQSYQTSLTQGMSDAERQFTADRKKLADTEADAGRAYSGFRMQATDKLNNDETSIINSSISAAKDKLNSMSQSFESKYGTDAYKQYLGASPALAFKNAATGLQDSVAVAPLGGIAGSDPLGNKSDVLTKESDLLSLNTK